MADQLRVLVVATKSPWPSALGGRVAVGGGRVAVGGLVEALAAAGCAVRVVTPTGTDRRDAAQHPLLRTVPVAPRSWAAVLGRAVGGASAVVGRWALAPLAAAVEEEIAAFRPDLIHLEQVHLGWLAPRLVGRVPIVLRQENVESELLDQLANLAPWPARAVLRAEARALGRFEAQTCRLVDLVAAISAPDALALRRVAPGAVVEVLPTVAPAAPTGPRVTLVGRPSFLCIGSFDWWPNRDGATWLTREVWPQLRRWLPDAVLHLAGPGSASIGRWRVGIVHHGVVASAADLYDPATTALIPVRAASGVRIRLLEAWAAGVPAVSTQVGVMGLISPGGPGAVVAVTAADFARAAARAASDDGLRADLVEQGSAALAEFAPEKVAARAIELYRQAITVFAARRPGA